MDYRRYSRATAFTGVANAVIYARNLVLLPILARELGPAAYGVWAQVSAALELLIPISLLGLPAAVNRLLPAEGDPRERRTGYWSAFHASLAVAACLAVVAALGTRWLFPALTQRWGVSTGFVRVGAVVLVCSSASASCANYFRTYQRPVGYSGLMLLESVGFLVLTYALAESGWGIWSPLVGLGVMRAATCALGLPVVARDLGWAGVDWGRLRVFLSYSLPLVPLSVLYWITQMSDRYLVGYFMTESDVGRYAANYSLGGTIAFLFSPVFAFLLPSASRLWDRGEHVELGRFLRHGLKYPLLLALPVLCTVHLWAAPVTRWLAGRDFLVAPVVVFAVMAGYLSLMVGTYFAVILHLRKDTRSILWINVATAGGNALLNLALIPRLGILGAALTTALCFAGQTAAFFALSRRYLRFDLGGSELARAAAAAAIAGATAPYLARIVQAGWGGGLVGAAALYLALVWATQVIRRQELAFFASVAASWVRRRTA